MQYNEKIIIDANKLLESGLDINDFFILNCIYQRRMDILNKYDSYIDGFDFSTLISTGYLSEDKKLTEKAYKLLDGEQLDHERFFNDLRRSYPGRIKTGFNKYRVLHLNMSACKAKYKSIVKSENMHNDIISCIPMYIKDAGDYIQTLPVWLNQKNYEVYLESINDIKKNLMEDDEYTGA